MSADTCDGNRPTFQRRDVLASGVPASWIDCHTAPEHHNSVHDAASGTTRSATVNKSTNTSCKELWMNRPFLTPVLHWQRGCTTVRSLNSMNQAQTSKRRNELHSRDHKAYLLTYLLTYLLRGSEDVDGSVHGNNHALSGIYSVPIILWRCQ
jgi:hypothetical protein